MMEAVPPTEAAGHVPTLAEDPALGLDRRAKFEILGAILLALFLGALDQTIVGTALPRVVTDLGGNDLYVWVVTIYLLTSTISVPFYGKLSDLYGRRPLLMIGISIFLVGSFLSGLSQTMWQLILFRGLQGLGAGALFPISLAVIGDLFTPQERGKYQGLFGAVFGIAALIGPALGGFITDTWSWHWIFFVNIPIGIVSLIVIWHLLPTVKRPDASRNFDLLGAGVFIVGVALLLIGLTNKQTNDWTDPSVGGLLLVSFVLLAIFLVIEWRAKEPIVPLDLWLNRTYAGSMTAVFLASIGFFGSIIFLPRWFQVVRGVSATLSGYQVMALLVGLIISSIISGQIVARTGRYKWLTVASLLITALGLYLMTNLKTDTDLPVLWFWMFVTGVGIGPSLAVFTIIIQNAVPFDRLGVATGNLTFFRQIGGSVGLAIVGTVFGQAITDDLPRSLVANGIPPEFASQGTGSFDLNQFTGAGVNLHDLLASLLPPAAQPFIDNIIKAIYDSFSYAVAQTFWIGVVASLAAAAVAAVLIKEVPLRSTFGARQPAGAPAGQAGTGPLGTAPGRPIPEPVHISEASPRPD